MTDSGSTFDKLQDLEHENDNLRKTRESDTLTIERYQEDLQRAQAAVKEKAAQIARHEEKHSEAQRQWDAIRQDYEHTLDEAKGVVQQLRAANEKLERQVEDQAANAAHNESILKRAYDDQEALREAYAANTRAKDDGEAKLLDLQLRHDSLFAQWQEDQAKIAELESRNDQITQFEAQYANMEADYAAQGNIITGHRRELMVKDERITLLEAQVQRERQRNLDAADAAANAAIAAATSPGNEVPPTLSALGDSLADELLSEHYYESDNESEDRAHDTAFYSNELSEIREVFAIAPIEPAIQQLSIGANANVSIAPVDIPPQSLTTSVMESARISPIAVVTPTLSLSISEIGSVAPVARIIDVTSTSAQTDLEDFTCEVTHVASVDIEPVLPIVVATTTSSTQTLSTQLTSNIIDTAFMDVVPTVPASSLSIATITTTFEEAPIEAFSPETAANTISSITVTHDEAPIKIDSSKPATTTAAVQTTETPTPLVETRIVEATKSNETGFLRTLFKVLAVLLVLLVLWRYMQSQAGHLANDYSYGSGSSYERGGAYGNGRYFLGVPLAMGIGDSWWGEQFASIASRAIMGYEKWSGNEYVPMY